MLYRRTVSLCTLCARDSPSWYDGTSEGMFLHTECTEHGEQVEQVETDAAFFRECYELEYSKPVPHLVLPVTYRCNLDCRYCYTMSNQRRRVPEDRPVERIREIARGFNGNVTLIGGEPTVRDDLMDLVAALKADRPDRKVSLSTNGQKLARTEYVKALREHGLDFVFLSVNDPRYEISEEVHQKRLAALRNCGEVRLPVWLHQTIDDVAQMDFLPRLLAQHRRTIFQVTVRAVKRFGVRSPEKFISLSAMLSRLGMRQTSLAGTCPFNRKVLVHGRPVKVSAWVSDAPRVDPVDSAYVLCDDTLTTFHRGMRMDEVLMKRRFGAGTPQPAAGSTRDG